jgi:flagellar protein FlgJ
MPSSLINSPAHSMPAKTVMPMLNGRPDYQLADALTKVPQQAQAKAKSTATDFEAMFLNSMFSQMTSGLKGEGPFGDKAGGIGISNDVYRTLILQQAGTAG